MNAAIIVAHPDDEIIWSGGLILQRADWDWTVLSLCRASDTDRAPKFEAVCSLLGLAGFIADVDDGDPLASIDPREEMAPVITDHLSETPWDLVLTHGGGGEYGHPRHREAHGEVVRLVSEGCLDCKALWTFAYECDVARAECGPGPECDVSVPLTREQLAEKKRIVREVYGYGEGSFEVRACISPECFLRLRGKAGRGEEAT